MSELSEMIGTMEVSLNTVTLHIDRYEQLIKDSARLQILREYISGEEYVSAENIKMLITGKAESNENI